MGVVHIGLGGGAGLGTRRWAVGTRAAVLQAAVAAGGVPTGPPGAAGALMLSSHEDGLARYPVHVDAGAGLQVVEMDEAVLRHEIDDAVLLRYLHCDREVIRGFRREIDVNGLLRERRVGGCVVDFHNVKLRT